MNFFLPALVFSRENRRPKTAKTKIYFTFGGCRASRCGSLFGAVVVSTCGRWCRVQGLPWCVPSLSPCLLSALPLCLWCVGLKYAFISHSKGVFSVFWGVCVGLYYLRALCGSWGLCTRVELGGFGSCGVFASMLSSRLPFVFFSCLLVLLPCLASCLACFPALCLGFLALWLGFWCWLGCCFFFPCGRLQT